MTPAKERYLSHVSKLVDLTVVPDTEEAQYMPIMIQELT